MVVATHALSYTAMDSDSEVAFWVHTIAVPPFFLVDGYLFFDALQRPGAFSYKTYVFKSARRLLLPWFLLTCLYGLVRALFEWKGLLEARIIVGQGPVEPLQRLGLSDPARRVARRGG